MANPYTEAATAILAKLQANSISAVRTRAHRFDRSKFDEIFGGSPGVIVSKASVARNLSNVCRENRRADVSVYVTIVDTTRNRDPSDNTDDDAFDNFVNTIESHLVDGLNTPTYGELEWVSSEEVDDTELTRNVGDLETTLQINYFVDSTEV